MIRSPSLCDCATDPGPAPSRARLSTAAHLNPRPTARQIQKTERQQWLERHPKGLKGIKPPHTRRILPNLPKPAK